VAFFKVVTHTAGGWQGPIGQLVADVTLRDGLTTQDLIWPGERIPPTLGAGIYPDSSVTQPPRAGWQLLDATHLRLTWASFEPRTQPDRAGFQLVARGS